MNDLVKYGLIAVGAYFVYEYFVSSSTAAASTAVTGTSTTPQAANPNANVAAMQTATFQAIVNKLNSDKVDPNSYQTADFWNYYYQEIRGIPGPAPESLNLPGYVAGAKYNLGQWWNSMMNAGFSGLGLIAHHVNPYINAFQQQDEFGANLVPTGMEMYIKRLQ